MAEEVKIPGTNLAAPIVPFTTADTYPTHYAKYGKGGYRSVWKLTDLDAIPENLREIGMLVFVQEDQRLYILEDDGTWGKVGIGIFDEHRHSSDDVSITEGTYEGDTLTDAITGLDADKADKADSLAGYGITNAYTKDEVDNKVKAVSDKVTALGSVLNFKGTKASKDLLPTDTNKPTTGDVKPATGDVWHVTTDSGEYVWDGSKWEELGSTIDLSGYVAKDDIEIITEADIDELFA